MGDIKLNIPKLNCVRKGNVFALKISKKIPQAALYVINRSGLNISVTILYSFRS